MSRHCRVAVTSLVATGAAGSGLAGVSTQCGACDRLGHDHALLQAQRSSLTTASSSVVGEPHLYTERSMVVDQGGGVRSEFRVRTAVECAAHCDAAAACRSFSYSAWERACHLKDKEVTEEDPAKVHSTWHYRTYMRSGPSRSSAVAMSPPSGPEGPLAPERVYVARSVVAEDGHELGAKSGATAEECKALCDNTQGCQSFTFSALQRSCYLKDRHVAADDEAAKPYLDFKTYMVTGEVSPERDGKVSPDEWEFFQLLNQRRARGLACPDSSSYGWSWGSHNQGNQKEEFEPNPVALKFDCRLWRAARQAAKELASQRATGCSGRWDTENYCVGPEDSATALESFQYYEHPCKNMMNPGATSIGIASWGSQPRYRTLEFGWGQGDVDTTCYP